MLGDALCDDGFVVRDAGPCVRSKPVELTTKCLKSLELSGVCRPVSIRRWRHLDVHLRLGHQIKTIIRQQVACESGLMDPQVVVVMPVDL